MKKILLFLLLSGCGNFQLNLDNDVFAHTDSNFSNKIQLKSSANPESLPDSIESLFSKIPAYQKEIDPNNASRYTFGLRQDMYTPKDISSRDIQPDSPYAGTLTFDTQKIYLLPQKKIAATVRLGISGPPSGAADTQKFIHDTLTQLGDPNVHPNGWPNQIKTEPLANYDYERTWEDVRLSEKHYEATTQGSQLIRLGNILTEYDVSYGFKFGNRIPYFTDLGNSPFSLFMFSNIFGISRLQDIYFQGGIFRDSPHTVDIEHFIGGIENGVELDYHSCSGKFVFNTRTRDYKTQEDSTHSFGVLSFGVNW